MINSVYLYLGPEEGKKKHQIQLIEKSLEKELGEVPEKHNFYSFEKSMDDIVSLMKNGSLFSTHKLVLISNIEEIKKKNDLELLIEICKKPVKGNTLILTSSNSSVEKKIENAVPKNNKIIFWEMFENQKKEWIESYFSKFKQKITNSAVEHLLDMVENNTQELKIACEKISFFFGEGKLITENEIDSYLYHSREESVFTLFDKMLTRDLESSLEIFSKLILSSDSNAVSIISGLSMQFKKLLTLKTLIKEGYNQDEAFSKVGIYIKKQKSQFIDGLRVFSIHELQKIMLIISDTDFDVRNAKLEMQNILLEILIYKCIVKIS